MSDFADEQQIIFDFINDNWTPLTDGPLVFPNHEEPQSGAGTFYSSVALIPNEFARTRNSIGAPKLIRNRGYIFFTIYAPKDSGSLRSTALRDKITDLFDERVFSLTGGRRVVCGICEPQVLGLKDNLWRTAVTIPFHRDEWPT